MKWFKTLIDKLILNRKAIQFYFFIACIVIVIIAIVSRQVAIKQNVNNQVEIQRLTTEMQNISSQKMILDTRLKSSQIAMDKLEREKEEIAKERDQNALERDRMKRERDSAIAKLIPMTDDELFERFIQLFPQSGSKEYIVNENQVREVVTVTVLYEHVKQDNLALEKDIEDCDRMVLKGDSIAAKQESMIADLNKKDSLNNEIILNLSEQNDVKDKEIKQGKRKLFWTKAGAGVIIVGQAIIIIINQIA